jgi:GR25 family glycosyltransferase involved in LPS biosynthesis
MNEIQYLNGIDVVYWINLDRATDRKKQMEKVLQDPIFNTTKNIRIKAFDGEKNNPRAKFLLEQDNNLNSANLTKTDNEYAILYSHLETIRTFSKTNYKNAIIFEDDLSLEYKKYWKKSVQEIMDHAPKDWEIIKLSSHAGKIYTKLYNEWQPFSLTIPPELKQDKYKWKNKIFIGDWSANGYIINNKAAKKIINKLYHNNIYNLDNKYLHVSDGLIYQMLKTYVYKYPYFTTNSNSYSYNLKHNKKQKFSNFTKKVITNMYKKLTRKNIT